MKNRIASIFRRITGKQVMKDREALRREYEEVKYDHYLAYGSAFMNFCSGKW